MSTISSFRAETRRGGMALYLVLAAGCAAQVSPAAPDAPRPAAPVSDKRPPEVDSSALRGTIEITSVRVRKLDAILEKMAGPAFIEGAREPLAIEVRTEKPLPKEARSTSAILIVNGERYADTWSIAPDRLVAFVQDRRKIKSVNTVAAAWLGSEATSASRRPLQFRAADIER